MACRQIERIQIENAEKRVGLVSFGSEVYVLGDGSQAKTSVSDKDVLDDFDKLTEEGKKVAATLNIEPLTSSYR